MADIGLFQKKKTKREDGGRKGEGSRGRVEDIIFENPPE